MTFEILDFEGNIYEKVDYLVGDVFLDLIETILSK